MHSAIMCLDTVSLLIDRAYPSRHICNKSPLLNHAAHRFEEKMWFSHPHFPRHTCTCSHHSSSSFDGTRHKMRAPSPKPQLHKKQRLATCNHEERGTTGRQHHTRMLTHSQHTARQTKVEYRNLAQQRNYEGLCCDCDDVLKSLCSPW